jgi:catechol-2,3-dioxygenase
MTPNLEAFDHVHVYVTDRAASEIWYREVLGLCRSEELEFWAVDGGPLTIQNHSGTVHLALFERSPLTNHATIALRVNAAEYLRWRDHLREALAGQFSEQDHQVSLSLYFSDLDGNPFEITTYDHVSVKSATP